MRKNSQADAKTDRETQLKSLPRDYHQRGNYCEPFTSVAG